MHETRWGRGRGNEALKMQITAALAHTHHLQQMRRHVTSEVAGYERNVERLSNYRPRVPCGRQLHLPHLISSMSRVRHCDADDHVGGVWSQ
jgi:hypothetical protein